MNPRNIIRISLQISTIGCILMVNSCDKKNSTSPDVNEVIISDKVVLPDEDPSITIDEIGEDQITLTFSGDQPDINENDILVGGNAENGGYLRKVTAVAVNGNTMEIQTTQATLVEAIEQGSLDTTLTLDFGGSNRSLYNLELVRKLDGVTVRDNGIDISGTELFNDNFNGTDVLISIPTGTITFTPNLNLGFDINWFGHLHEFHTIASGNLNFNFDIRGEFSGSLAGFNNDDNPVELASFSNSFYQAVGIVPVWETVTLAFEAGYSVDIGYSGSVQAGFDSNIGIESGATWEEGVWSGVWNPSYNFNWHPPEWNAEAHVEIRGYVRPTITIELYSMAGPYLDVEPYARLDASVETNPPTWAWGLYGGMESTLGFQIQVLDWELANWNTELLDPPYENTIASDSGEIISNTPPEIVSLTANPDEILVYQSSQITCSAIDNDGDNLTYNWTSTCGSITGTDSTVTYTAPATPGDCTVSCNVMDGQGGSDNATVAIAVNGPPGAVTMASPSDNQENLPTEITFSWYAVSSAEHYDLQISTDPSFSSYQYFFENITNLETTVSDLDEGTLYTWHVRAGNTHGDGPWPVDSFSFTTGTLSAVPQLLSPANDSFNQPFDLQFSWTAVEDAVGYIIEVSEFENYEENFFSGPTEENSIEITGLSDNTIYYWHVSAYDNNGSGAYSGTWHFSTRGASDCIDIDGNVYDTVTIGDQAWMAENLKVTHYRNGDEIPTGFDSSQWGNLSSGAYDIYPADNDDASQATCNEDCEEVYGALYNWFAVNDSRGVCPEGWHVPTEGEWIALWDYLGYNNGGKLKATGTIEAGTGQWYSPNTGATNETGFTAIPGGGRYSDGGEYNMGYYAFYWTSTLTDYNESFAWYRLFYYGYNYFSRMGGERQNGLSVRCLQSVESR
ncbi:MAG: hypothetical protein GXO91_11155 [FCB group bacterium]|nr:hypothetical protein [FCB group bacterium]